jgi:hypothetical protein
LTSSASCCKSDFKGQNPPEEAVAPSVSLVPFLSLLKKTFFFFVALRNVFLISFVIRQRPSFTAPVLFLLALKVRVNRANVISTI